jgi:putative transposase
MEIYQQSDYRYGYRKISHALKNKHILINHKKVLGLMQEMNIQGLFPKRKVNTSKSALNQCVYPYLLEGMVIDHPNQVWGTDITYSVPGAQGKYGYLNELQIYLKFPVRAQGIMVH